MDIDNPEYMYALIKAWNDVNYKIMAINQTFTIWKFASKAFTAQRKPRADPAQPLARVITERLKSQRSHIFHYFIWCFCWNPTEVCVVASCEPVLVFYFSFSDLKSLVHIKATAHLVLGRGRGQVDTRGLHFSSGAMSGCSGGLAATQKCSPHTSGRLIRVWRNRIAISWMSVGKLAAL